MLKNVLGLYLFSVVHTSVLGGYVFPLMTMNLLFLTIYSDSALILHTKEGL